MEETATKTLNERDQWSGFGDAQRGLSQHSHYSLLLAGWGNLQQVNKFDWEFCVLRQLHYALIQSHYDGKQNIKPGHMQLYTANVHFIMKYLCPSVMLD